MDVRNNSDRVEAFTEWDPLEEVIVGKIDGAVVPTWQEAMRATMPPSSWELFQQRGGQPFDADHLKRAEEEMEGLVQLLERQNIRVKRPSTTSHARPFSTPDWHVDGGLYSAMPRDGILVVGDMFIEAPMSWRSRYHEAIPFRPLARQYFQNGARWVSAPRPQLRDDVFESNGQWACNENEPLFDAADFIKFGADLVAQRSHVTNLMGIEWVQRTLGSQIQVHTIPVDDPHAMHIDATLMPLAPGKLLVNPKRFVQNSLFDGWDVREAPPGTTPEDWPMHFCSSWVSMNVLSLDSETVIVEEHELPLIDMLQTWGFRCLPLPFRHVYSLGGSFHCVTVDIRRRGGMGRYLNRTEAA